MEKVAALSSIDGENYFNCMRGILWLLYFTLIFIIYLINFEKNIQILYMPKAALCNH